MVFLKNLLSHSCCVGVCVSLGLCVCFHSCSNEKGACTEKMYTNYEDVNENKIVIYYYYDHRLCIRYIRLKHNNKSYDIFEKIQNRLKV